MAPFHDIDPSTATPQQPGRKMEYIIAGTAPCRKFVLNFYNIPYYKCPDALVTQQIVLYEGTGIIDIFLKAGGGEKVFDKSTKLEELVVWVQDRRPAPGH